MDRQESECIEKLEAALERIWILSCSGDDPLLLKIGREVIDVFGGAELERRMRERHAKETAP